MPTELPSWPCDIQVTTYPPSANAATDWELWRSVIYVLTWNSPPTVWFEASYRWP